jgi:murein DD-endopeptidase MepM/ murein hydrolase activator NlpD
MLLPPAHAFAVAAAASTIALSAILGEGDERQRRALEALPPPSMVQFEVAPPVAFDPWQHTEIRPGESMAVVFSRAGLASADLAALTATKANRDVVARLHPGQKVSFRVDGGELVAIRVQVDAMRSVEFTRAGEGFEKADIERTPERRLTSARGTIRSSLYVSAREAGLPAEMILNLAQIFQWDIDFVLDIRAGDRFAIVYEKLVVDGTQVGNGGILAAEFVNQGRRFQAVRHVGADGHVGYYAPDGRSMRKAFLRAPVDFTRISSAFNPKRLHPVIGKVRPHRGVDYAAPNGTPVYAAGDGRVVTAASHHASGRHVVLQHGSRYQTRYLHLSRIAQGMTPGRRVRQGDVIGYVGSTGWATGPHLHYEFIVDGVHKDPRGVQLALADPVPEAERARFTQVAANWLQALQSYAAAEVAASEG